MHAAVVGATGATGKELLKLLAVDESFTQVDVFVRRKIDSPHQKFNNHIINFDRHEQWQHLVKGDVLFSCLGTTLKAAGSKEAQWKVDYDYQYEFAKAAKANRIENYVLVSSALASADSKFYYTRMKGELEDAVKALQFPTTIILQPPVLERDGSDRLFENVSVSLLKGFNKLNLFKSQTPMHTRDLALAMINAYKDLPEGTHTFVGQDILQFSSKP